MIRTCTTQYANENFYCEFIRHTCNGLLKLTFIHIHNFIANDGTRTIEITSYVVQNRYLNNTLIYT